MCDLFDPHVAVEVHDLLALLFCEIEAAPVHVFVSRHPVEWRFDVRLYKRDIYRYDKCNGGTRKSGKGSFQGN